MKIRSHILARFGSRFRNRLALAGLAAGLPLAAWAQSNTVTVAGSFVEAMQFPNTGYTVDTRVDNSVGTPRSGITYVLAADYNSHGYLRRFDPSGADGTFANGSLQLTLNSITPAAMAVVPGTTNIYVVGGSTIEEISADTGQTINSQSLPSSVSLKSVFWDGTNVVVCGNFNGGTQTILGHTATARGSQAGIIIKLTASLSSTAVGLMTFGCTGSGAINTADSVVVDENFDIYVSGKLGNGNFNSDVFNGGTWSVLTKTGSSVNSLEDAYNLLHNSSVAGTSSTTATINDTAPSANYIYHATGTFIANAAGTYWFDNTSDDGSWLYVDGNQLIYDDSQHGSETFSNSITLGLGLHTVDWLYFNAGGPGLGKFQYTGPGVSSLTFVPAADIGSNKGYILKFSGDFTSLKGVYSSQQSAGAGSEVKQIAYSQGFVYGVGYWQGNADNPTINPPDPSNSGSQNAEVLKLDTALQLKARATVKGAANNSGYSVAVDDSGNAYISGSEGPASSDFFGNGDPTNQPFTSISSAKPSIFIAQLDSNFKFKWVNTPTTPSPDFNLTVAPPQVRWNSSLQRVFWMGYFTDNQLLMGNPTTAQTLNGPEGFVAVLDPSGAFTERVLLTIISAYGIGGVQVTPFGGPSGGSNNPVVIGVNTKPVIKGAQVTAAVPSYLYWDINNVDITSAALADSSIIDSEAETRIDCVGYAVGNNVANGTANSYTFTIGQNTIVQFNWTVEHALRITSDFSETEGSDPGAIGHIVGLKSDASGSPDPTVEKHWVAENSPVIASVDAYVDDQNYLAQGLAVRYTIIGYDAYGPANTLGSPGNTNFITFVGNDSRRQVPQFLMTGPAGITYHWKLKIGVEVGTTGLSSINYPVIHVLSDPGQQPPTQPDGMGSGTFFYDEGTSLQIGTLRNQGTTAAQGWLNGDGTVFPSSGSVSNLTGSFQISGNGVTSNYVSQPVPNFNRPARVTWDYGDRIFDETVFIGDTVTFSTVDDPAVRAILLTNQPPSEIQILQSPQGSTGGDMGMWDAIGKKYYPLRPGVVMSYWQTSADPNDFVIIRLTIQYPVVPHYQHIANTPSVNLEPNTNGSISFVALKYTDSTTGAAVDSNNGFTATGPGMTVLQFSQTSSSGRGGNIVTPRIRVVQTRNWNDNLPNTQTAIIGQKITSSYDTAGLGTGFLFFQNARYNASIYNRTTISGPIIPVNLNPTANATQQLVVVWYQSRDTILWPYQAVRYQPAWPTTPVQGLHRIVISSRYGNESVAQDGTDQQVVPSETYGTNTYPAETMFDPARFLNVQVYNQPDPTQPGYNPNEEHALLAPSLRSAAVAPQPMAVYALRNGDLNVTNQDATYTSDPYVLVQFYDNIAQQYRMAVYNITMTASNLNAGDLSYNYTFTDQMNAGEPVIPFYPLPQVIGATPCSGTYGKDGQPSQQICYWKDHKGDGWAVSGNSFFTVYYFYPMLPDFWWPGGAKQPGDCVAFLPNSPGFAGSSFTNINYTLNNQTPAAQGITYTTVWPLDVPILKVGETLTFPGGEYASDNPDTIVLDDLGNFVDEPTPGLPGVVGFAAGQVVYDTANPTMDDQKAFTNNSAWIFPALEQRTVPLSVSDFPTELLPANGRTTVQNGVYVFGDLPASLQKRIFYDPINAVLGIQGYLNDKNISDPTLTASPPAVYVLEPNVLTAAEKAILDGSGGTSPYQDLAGSKFATAMDALYNLTRNPNQLDQHGDGVDVAYRVGLDQKIKVNSSTGKPLLTTNGTIITVQRDPTKAMPMQALGPGLAMVANPSFLDPNNPVQISYVTVAENNDNSLGGTPVALHIIKIDKTQRYRGSIMTVLSPNVFDENIELRHTADFGGNADDLVFEWWYRPEDGTSALPPDTQPSPNPWQLFADPSGNQGLGFYQLTMKGSPNAPEVLLGDTLWFMRYRHRNEVHNGENWEVTQPNGERRCVLGNCVPGIPYDWAGAGNSSPQDLDGDGQPDYVPQLVEGWVKRVLTAINPYETRISDFNQNTPAVYQSIIQQLGAPYSGPVALNPDPNVIQNVGLIALYTTIMNRAEDLSINLSTPIDSDSISDAIELASTRLSDFYQLLGNDAYADSQDPAIGYGSDSIEYGNLATTVFAFENQLPSRLDEELGLLRGETANNGTPVFNRLYWNFTHEEGEAAYVMKYNITDINHDGVIDVNDAMTLYPQGHGDAWGDYVTASRYTYDLLRNPYFNWVSRSEYINSQNIVIPVDYLDERKFAQNAANKAQAGAQIVSMTYRQKYVADPRGQWQGYLDSDPNQAWGVEEWSRRAGQAAFFDWVTANALLPAVHPNTNYTGIQKVDRTTVTDISTIAANFVAIQDTMDQVDGGNNPLGLHNGALSFAIDPTFAVQNPVNTGNGLGDNNYFDQIYAKAVSALNNAKAAFDNANQYDNLLRNVANNQASLNNEEYEQDLSYRNQLIEIFGTPYPGTIGSGKLYPAGYQGPDISLYNYVDVNNVNDQTVPQPSLSFLSNYQDETSGSDATLVHGFGFLFNATGIPSSWKNQFNLTFLNGTADTVNLTDFATTNNISTNDMLQNLNLPVMADGYSYVAPSDWGVRSSVGQLQQNINAMVQAQADVDSELIKWQEAQTTLINKLRYLNAKYEWDADIQMLNLSKEIFDTGSDALSGVLDMASKVADAAAVFAKDTANAGQTFVPTMLPEFGLADSPGDALSTVRGGIEVGGLAVSLGSKLSSETLDGLAIANSIVKFVGDQGFDQSVENYSSWEELLPDLQELQTMGQEEADQRVAVFKAVQALDSAGNDYRTTLANGSRLLQERSNYNKQIAAQNQQSQYQDLMFRFSRDAALEQYRSTFDLASRYAYLAASAYDYDLNLGPDDPGSPLDLMADIVHQRTIGLVDDNGDPQVGSGGLAEDLAKLNANYQTLSARMGLLNPLQENQTFSLRSMAFRITLDTNSDSTWQQKLLSPGIYQTNLWDVPEYAVYCRSFASQSNGPQPGLVIPFSTTIQAGLNYFGWPLGAGDVAYDPSVYSTRIASVCVGMAGYDTTTMSASPRVYLIPVGSDVMSIPNSVNHDLRYWNVCDQNIPLPYPATSADFSDPNWRPMVDSVTDSSGTFGDIRQFSSFLADIGPAASGDSPVFDFSSYITTADRRLVGRSVWNTRWLLIIPGAYLEADPNAGLNDFINSVNDIQLNITSYGYSGN